MPCPRAPTRSTSKRRTPSGTGALAASTTFVKDTIGPVVNSVTVSPNPSVASPTISSSLSDASTITAAEYWIDSPGAAGTGTPMTTAGGVTSANFATTFGGLTAGSHTIYVDAKDALGQWGAQGSTTFTKNLESPAVPPVTTSRPASSSGPPVASP